MSGFIQNNAFTNPDINGLFDDWQQGTYLIVAFEGGAAQGHLMSIFNGIVTLTGPDAVIFVDNTHIPVPIINIRLSEVQSVAFVAPA